MRRFDDQGGWNPRFPNKYDLVCSMGHFCGTATYLKRHHLRRASGPLDWIGGAPSGLTGLAKLICEDFKGFLEFASLTKLEHEIGEHADMRNENCRDEKTGILLFHDFAYGVPLSETFPEVRRTYDRRIARFYRMISEARKTLLVWHTRYFHTDVEEIKAALAMLRAKLGDGIDILAIENVEEMPSPAFREVAPGAYYAKGYFNRTDIDWMLGDVPVLDRLYGAIPFRHKRLRLLYRELCKILASLHFSREARHLARERAGIKE